MLLGIFCNVSICPFRLLEQELKLKHDVVLLLRLEVCGGVVPVVVVVPLVVLWWS